MKTNKHLITLNSSSSSSSFIQLTTTYDFYKLKANRATGILLAHMGLQKKTDIASKKKVHYKHW